MEDRAANTACVAMAQTRVAYMATSGAKGTTEASQAKGTRLSEGPSRGAKTDGALAASRVASVDSSVSAPDMLRRTPSITQVANVLTTCPSKTYSHTACPWTSSPLHGETPVLLPSTLQNPAISLDEGAACSLRENHEPCHSHQVPFSPVAVNPSTPPSTDLVGSSPPAWTGLKSYSSKVCGCSWAARVRTFGNL